MFGDEDDGKDYEEDFLGRISCVSDGDAGCGVFCEIQVEGVSPTATTSTRTKLTVSSLPVSTYFSIQFSPIPVQDEERNRTGSRDLDSSIVYVPMPAMPQPRRG